MTALPEQAPRPNPYAGPRAFQPGERLHGRDRDLDELTDLLVAQRIVLLYSPSGAGKTSLLQAALAPRLRDEGFHVWPIMRVSLRPAEGAALPAGANRYVLSALLALEKDVPAERRVPLAELAATSLPAYLDRRRDAEGSAGEVLLFDQFEEVLTLDATDREGKQEFFVQLGTALRERVRWAVLAMREDFLAGLDPYLRLVPTRLRAQFRLELLGPDAALQAVVRPARDAGVEFTDAAARRLVDDLRRVKVQNADGTREEQLGPSVEPMQLQVACRQLWDRLPPDDFEIDERDVEEVGDVDAALAGYYAESVGRVAAETGVSERKLRDWFELRLITPQGIRGQVLLGPEESDGLPNRVAWAITGTHLVRAEKRLGSTWFELAHDRLIEPVRADNSAWRATRLSPMQRQAAAWARNGQPERLLMTGDEIDAACAWSAEHAAEMTPDETRFLEESQRAQRALRREQAQRRRIRILQAIATGLAVVVAVAAVVLFVRTRREDRNALVAESRLLADVAIEDLYTHPQRGLLLAIEAWRLGRRADPVASEAALRSLRDLLATIGGDPFDLGTVSAAAMSPDGRSLVTANAAGEASLVDLAQPKRPPRRLLTAGTHDVMALGYGPDGKWIVIAMDDGVLHGWPIDPPGAPEVQLNIGSRHATCLAVGPARDAPPRVAVATDAGLLVWSLAAPEAAPVDLGIGLGPQAMGFSADGRWLAAGGVGGAVEVWATSSSPAAMPTLVFHADVHQDTVTALEFSDDGRHLGTGSRNGTSAIFDVTDVGPWPFRMATPHSDDVTCLAFSPDGRWFATGGRDRTVLQEDLANPSASAGVMGTHQDEVVALGYSPDSRWLATGARDHVARFWDARCAGRRWIYGGGHEGDVLTIGFRASDGAPVTASADGTGRVWDLARTATLRQLFHARGDVRGLAFTPDGGHLVAATTGGAPWIWETADPAAEPDILDGGSHPLAAAAMSPDGHLLAVADGGDILTWDVTEGFVPAGMEDPVRPDSFTAHGAEIRCLAFSPDGTLLASGSNDNTVRLCRAGAASDEPVVAFTRHEGDVTSVAFSTDGRLVASGCMDGVVRIWDVPKDGAKPSDPRELPRRPDAITAVVFEPHAPGGDDVLVSGCNDGTIEVWNLANTRMSPHVLRQESGVVAAVFSPDGRWLVTAGRDRAVRWWLPSSPEKHAREVRGPTHDIASLAFSPDRHWLAAGCVGGDVWCWRVEHAPDEAPEDLVRAGCERAGRNLTTWEWSRYLVSQAPRATCPAYPAPGEDE